MARLIIKEVAKKEGMNQSQLQLKAAVSPQLLNRYWNNRTRSVALDQLEKIAKALDVKPGDLIVSDEEESIDEPMGNLSTISGAATQASSRERT